MGRCQTEQYLPHDHRGHSGDAIYRVVSESLLRVWFPWEGGEFGLRRRRHQRLSTVRKHAQKNGVACVVRGPWCVVDRSRENKPRWSVNADARVVRLTLCMIHLAPGRLSAAEDVSRRTPHRRVAWPPESAEARYLLRNTHDPPGRGSAPQHPVPHAWNARVAPCTRVRVSLFRTFTESPT